ncbi:MAG: hypothetical protein ACYDBS_10215, partial [Acidimicrobiales bacterium]
NLFGFGPSQYCGGLARQLLPQDVAGVASMPNGAGYWIALKDGSVYAFGAARNYGDLRGAAWRGGPAAPGAPIVGISSSRDGKGYLLLAGDGSVYAFGDARYFGSLGSYRARGAPVGIATDNATGGYWVATSTGNLYNFGAPFYGSRTKGHAYPIVAVAALHSGRGYWMVTRSGYVFAFGAATNHGSKPGQPIVGIATAVGDRGYYLLSSRGNVYQLGPVPFDGSAVGRIGIDPTIGISTP